MKLGVLFREYVGIFTLLLLDLVLLFKFLVPFWINNNLQTVDFPGHFFSVWFSKSFGLLPQWNPFFYMGFPQSQFYPPLLSYLTNLFSLIMSLETATKLTISLFLLILPFSIYYCSRKFNLDRIKSSLVTGGVLLLMCLPQKYTSVHLVSGGSVAGTLFGGLITNMLGLVFFFFYAGSLRESFGTKKYLLPSVLLALIILTHIYTSFLAIFLLISFFFSIVLGGRIKDGFGFFLKHIFLAFGISAFFLLPFLFKLSFSHTTYVLASFNYWNISLIFLGIVFSSLIFLKRKIQFLSLAILFYLIIFLVLLGNLLGVALHFYRFLFYALLILPFLIVPFISKKISLLLIGGVFLILILLPNITYSPRIDDFNFYNVGRLEGRTLLMPWIQPEKHVINSWYPITTGNYGVKGLFIESSPNGVYVNDLEGVIYPYYTHWGVEPRKNITIQNQSLKKEILTNQLNLFQINYFIADRSYGIFNDTLRKVVGNFNNTDYYLYEVGNSSLVEIVNYTPKAIAKNWDIESRNWFSSIDNLKILVFSSEVPETNVGEANRANVLNLSYSILQDDVHFYVDSEEEIPVLIKISYFPNWRAYANGNELKIYRASPHLMLVYAKGEVELKYQLLFVDVLGYAFSTFTLLILALLSLWNLRKVFKYRFSVLSYEKEENWKQTE